MNVRTRFAPSPTGDLHLGSVRTALYSWLYARKHNGTFILRIEDTDLERSTDASAQAILEGMKWLGLDYDEGPFFQTKRFDRYHEVIQELITKGHAYYCTCSKERIEALRLQQQENKQKPRYDGHCRELNLKPSAEQSAVVRFRNPLDGEIIIDDQVFGEIKIQNSELDDLIIARSDGSPTYNFTVVVDDWDMNITHVIRGDDHINNTPRQINILKALGANIPTYAHLPMILGKDGKRLSKRDGAVNILQYRDAGYLSEAMLNYLVRLGWSHGDQEIFSIKEMTEYFNLKQVHKAAAAFDIEKLKWLNQHYMKTLSPSLILPRFKEYLEPNWLENTSSEMLQTLMTAQVERAKTLKEMAEKSAYFFTDDVEFDEQAVIKNFNPDVIPIFELLFNKFHEAQDWDKEQLHQLVKDTASELNVGLGKVAQPLRIAVTGNTASPSIDITLYLLGKQKTLNRIQKAINVIQHR